MIFGVLIGVWVGNDISEVLFKRIMAVIIIGSVLIMFYSEHRNSNNIPKNKLFEGITWF